MTSREHNSCFLCGSGPFDASGEARYRTFPSIHSTPIAFLPLPKSTRLTTSLVLITRLPAVEPMARIRNRTRQDIAALFQPLVVLSHLLRRPTVIFHGVGDTVPVRVARVHQNQNVVGPAAADHACPGIEDTILGGYVLS